MKKRNWKKSVAPSSFFLLLFGVEEHKKTVGLNGWQWAKDGENNGLIADFATRGVVLEERSRIVVLAAGGPGRASRGISLTAVSSSTARRD